MSAAPTVTIALSVHNSASTLEPALRSLQLQSFADWELLLFDDGSSDASAERATALADRRIRVLQDGLRLGLAARLNQAIDLARGKYFARMDADDVAYPERLAHQVAFLDRNPDVDLLGAGMMVFGDAGGPIGAYPVRSTHEDICVRPYSGFYLAHPTWMGRLEWFRRWRYDPTCRKAQDQDLLLRAYRSSRYAALPEILIGYRQPAVSVRKSVLGRYYFSRTVVRDAWSEARYAAGIAALLQQIGKAAFDAFAIWSGLSRRLLSHRAQPFPAIEAQRWQRVWASCHCSTIAAPGAVHA